MLDVRTDLIEYYADMPVWDSRLQITLDSPEGQELLQQAKALLGSEGLSDVAELRDRLRATEDELEEAEASRRELRNELRRSERTIEKIRKIAEDGV